MDESQIRALASRWEQIAGLHPEAESDPRTKVFNDTLRSCATELRKALLSAPPRPAEGWICEHAGTPGECQRVEPAPLPASPREAQEPMDAGKICPQDGSVCWDPFCDVKFCEQTAQAREEGR